MTLMIRTTLCTGEDSLRLSFVNGRPRNYCSFPGKATKELKTMLIPLILVEVLMTARLVSIPRTLMTPRASCRTFRHA